jgi:hypothetical protein
MENSYKLYYFGVNVKAANIRAILTYVKANWENSIIAAEDWPALKASGKFEFGQLPGLEVNSNGRILSQAIAIEHYLARQFNLLGKTPEDEYEVLSLLASREDIYIK